MIYLLVLSLLLQLLYLLVPELHQLLSPVFVALLAGLLAALLLPLFAVQPRLLLSTQLNTINRLQQKALRCGIVLFAFSVAPELVLQTNPVALLKLLLLVAVVLILAIWAGLKLFKLPKEMVLLVSAGLSFCGTSAIFATYSVRQPSQEQLSQSLAVVLLMGLLSLIGYGVVQQTGFLTGSELAWLIGSTAPEVSQAVAAGSQLGAEGSGAVMAKLFRVCLLVPFLVLLSLHQTKKDQLQFPWFILLFAAVLVLNIWLNLPDWLTQTALWLSQTCLIFAMLVSGVLTNWQDLRHCSGKVFLFAAVVMSCLFSFSYLLLKV